MKRLIGVLMVSTILMIHSNEAFSQCAMCKASVESNIENNKKVIGKGLNDGILYLMSIPYIVLGGIGFMVYKNWKSNGTEN